MSRNKVIRPGQWDINEVVKCPMCSRKYKLQGNIEDLRQENFVCKCGFWAPFTAILGNIDPPPIHPPGNNDGPITKRVNTSASLYIPSCNKRIPLHSGTQTLGRNSCDSTAELKLAPDPYMSREHALIEEKITDGKKFYYFEVMKGKSRVYINKKPCYPGKKVLLKNGYTLMLGETQVIFEIK